MGVQPVALVVLDPATRKLPGGTTTFVKRRQATALNRKAREIDLAAQQARPERPVAWLRRHPASRRGCHCAGHGPAPDQCEVRAMLFADVKDFSKLEEEQLRPISSRTFLDLVQTALVEGPTPPLFRNTWGDGLYLVFEDVVPCAPSPCVFWNRWRS